MIVMSRGVRVVGSRKILLVDDDPSCIEKEMSFLSQRVNIEVLQAFDGKEALETIREEHPDLVIMDLIMPVVDGDECCLAVKSDPLLKDIPVVLKSFLSDSETLSRCMMAGCDDFISKPVKLMDVLRKIRKHTDLPVRLDLRKSLETAVECCFEDKSGPGMMINISEGGMLFRSSVSVPVGSLIDTRFTLPDEKEKVDASAMVVRWDSMPQGESRNDTSGGIGLGVRFLALPPHVKAVIASLHTAPS